VETYLITRRGAWRTPAELRAATARSSEEGDKTPDELQAAAARSTEHGEKMPDDIRWIRSYVLAETNGELGTVCIYQASSPEAIRSHAYRAGLPVDEIVAVADTVVVRPDAQPIAI